MDEDLKKLALELYWAIRKKLDFFDDTEKNNQIYPELIKYINSLKETEQTLRVLIYPQHNEILLTYDEMKELGEAQKDWDKTSMKNSSEFDWEEFRQFFYNFYESQPRTKEDLFNWIKKYIS